MKQKHRLVRASVVVLIIATLAACAQEAATPTQETAPTETLPEESPIPVEETEEVAEVGQVSGATPAPRIDEHCADCHTDVERLKALATEAEPGEGLSSGEG